MTPLHPHFWLGAEQFNNREFYACHDTFEAIWMETLDDRTSTKDCCKSPSRSTTSAISIGKGQRRY